MAGAAVLWPAKSLSARSEIRIGPMVGVNNATFRGDDAGEGDIFAHCGGVGLESTAS